MSGHVDHWVPRAVSGTIDGANQVFTIPSYLRQVEIKLNGVEMLQATQLVPGAVPNITVVTSVAEGITTITFLDPIPQPNDAITAWGTQ